MKNLLSKMLVVLVVFTLVSGLLYCTNGNERELDVTILSKYHGNKTRIMDTNVRYGKAMAKKVIIETSEGVFEDSGNIMLGKVDNNSIYYRLKVGKRYRIKVVGSHILFSNCYPNIIEIVKEY